MYDYSGKLSENIINDEECLLRYVRTAAADNMVEILNTAIDGMCEADFSQDPLQTIHQLKVYAVRTERAFKLISERPPLTDTLDKVAYV